MEKRKIKLIVVIIMLRIRITNSEMNYENLDIYLMELN